MFANVDRNNLPFSLLLIDIDHFGRVNDELGHVNGDQVLQGVAGIVKSTLGNDGSLFRIGGEEYAVILPGVRSADAQHAAEQLRQAVESQPHRIGDCELAVTISVGIAEANQDLTKEQFTEHADQALLTAKSAGRNCCCYHDGAICRPVFQIPATSLKRLCNTMLNTFRTIVSREESHTDTPTSRSVQQPATPSGKAVAEVDSP